MIFGAQRGLSEVGRWFRNLIFWNFWIVIFLFVLFGMSLARLKLMRGTYEGVIARHDKELSSGAADGIGPLTRRKSILDSSFIELKKVNAQIRDALLDGEELDDEDFLKEIEINNQLEDSLAATLYKVESRLECLQDEALQKSLATPSNSSRSSISSPTTTVAKIKLLELVIEKYNGDVTKWSQFNGKFLEAVGNNNQLSGSRKLNYLLSFLEGEALDLVRNFEIKDDNYVIVY